jgi:hypothetical protein
MLVTVEMVVTVEKVETQALMLLLVVTVEPAAQVVLVEPVVLVEVTIQV